MKKQVLCLLVLCMCMVGCKKSEEGDGHSGGTDTVVQPTEQRVEEFVYNENLYFYREGSSNYIPRAAFADTAAKYAVDQNVKQIHIVPKTEHLLENVSNPTTIENKANALDAIYNESNNKLSGENTTLYLDSAVLSSQTVQDVLNGKLKINLVQR